MNFHPISDASRKRNRLREMLQADAAHIVPGVATALNAIQAERAGFDLLFVTGAGVANTILGVPDIGLLTLTESATITRYIVEAVDVPVIADGDTGHGGPLQVVRATREFVRAGVAGLIIEDQVDPKRCGHFDGKRVIALYEMVEKIIAARVASSDTNLVLIARTDALATEGLAGALRRVNAYSSAGADVIFVEAPTTREELAAIPPAVPVPCLVNMVEGGITPLLSCGELREMGYRLIIYANLALRAAAQGAAEALECLYRDGTSRGTLERILSWDERQQLVRLSEWEDLDESIRANAASWIGRGGPALDARGGPAQGDVVADARAAVEEHPS